MQEHNLNASIYNKAGVNWQNKLTSFLLKVLTIFG